MEQPTLTISILISDRKDTVRKCLNSIQPLLDAVPSELILTDTGCGEEVRKIIEEYTHHIIEFPWIRDFSAARNAGLKEAKGQWFMYIDDDEWFEDTQEIIDFFLSEESRDYNVACYVQRNYLDLQGTTFFEHRVDRILRLNPKLHFEHRVHEEYTDIKIGTKKILNSYVHHYGYIYANEAERKQKYNRNQELLEIECRENPDNMRMIHQLITNQYSEELWDKAIEIALPVIQKASNSEYWDLIHTEILFCLEKKEDWEQIIYYSKEFLKKDMFLYEIFGIAQYTITACWKLKRYSDAVNVIEEAFAMYEKYKLAPEAFNEQQLMLKTFFDEEHICKMIAYGISSLCNEKKVDILLKILSYDNSKEMRQLFEGKEYIYKKIILESMEQLDNLSEPLKTVTFRWIIEMPFYLRKGQEINIINYVPNEDFEMWENVLLRIIPPNTLEELCWFSGSFDRKLNQFLWYANKLPEELEKVQLAVDLFAGYGESMTCFCKNIYRDEVIAEADQLLSPKEQAAFVIQKMIGYMENGDLSSAIKCVKEILHLVPEWKDAIEYIPTWINLVFARMES